MDAHAQMELLKSNKKEIVSGANVAMPASFLKPLDYSIDLLVRSHPTLRQYCKQVDCTEIDPEYNLYPLERPRIMPKDEMQLKNAKKEEDKTFIMSLTKTVSGNFINTLDVPTYDVPGNFGVRVIETMPTDMRAVFIDQQNNINLGFVCDDRHTIVPRLLPAPDQNDYLTDEESDEGGDFEVKVPELDQLLTQFEGEDEVIHTEEAEIKKYAKDLVARGFEPESRYEITDNKAARNKMLDANIHAQREK